MDTKVAYWTEDPNGGLTLYNSANQKITTISSTQAKSYVAAYSAGNPAAVDVGKSFGGTTSGGASGGSGGSGGFTPVQAATQARQAAQDAYQRQQDTQGQANWQENYDVDKAKFNAQQGLAESQQKWREAVDARDFQAAEFWKNRSYEMQRNEMTRNATNDLYAAKRGPQDWVSYWYRSRGMTPPAGAQSVRVEDAVPQWAQPVEYGQGAPAWAQSGQQTSRDTSGTRGGGTKTEALPKNRIVGTANGPVVRADVTMNSGKKVSQDVPTNQFAGGVVPDWVTAAMQGKEGLMAPKNINQQLGR